MRLDWAKCHYGVDSKSYLEQLQDIAVQSYAEYAIGLIPALYDGADGAVGTGQIWPVNARDCSLSNVFHEYNGVTYINPDTLFYKQLSQRAKAPKKSMPLRYKILWKLIGLVGLILLIGWYYILWWAFA